MRRTSTLPALPGDLPSYWYLSTTVQCTELMHTDVEVSLHEAQGKWACPSSFQQAPSYFFHNLSLLLSLSYSCFPPCYLTFCFLLGLVFIYSLSPSLYPSLLFFSIPFHCLHFFPTLSNFRWFSTSDFGPSVHVGTSTKGPLIGPQGMTSSSRGWISTEPLDDEVPFKNSLSNHSPRILAN